MSTGTYIRLKVHGLPCWHLVDIAPTKQPLLPRLKVGGAIDINILGKVFASGWGVPHPTKSITIRLMRESVLLDSVVMRY